MTFTYDCWEIVRVYDKVRLGDSPDAPVWEVIERKERHEEWKFDKIVLRFHDERGNQFDREVVKFDRIWRKAYH